MSLTHVHSCDHCERTLSCHQDSCILPRDISQLHGCPERKLFKRRMSNALKDKGCKYGCTKLPCRHRGAIVFPRKGRFLVSDHCPYGCTTERGVEIAASKCTTHYNPKIADRPIVDSVTREHSTDCLCTRCKKQFASQYKLQRPNFAFKSILNASRAAMLPQPQSEREIALASILKRNSSTLNGKRDRVPNASEIASQKEQLVASIRQMERDSRLASLAGREKVVSSRLVIIKGG